jgi:L-arabinokinase
LSAILYYVTGHGYGHAVRSNLVIQALANAAPDLKVHVRTTAAAWLFHSAQRPVVYSSQAIDVGVVQRDSLDMDLATTLDACRALNKRIPALVKQEIDFIKTHGIQLILGDIPPLAFEIAARAAIPSVAVTNFTWSWIYRGYLNAFPTFLPLVEEMERGYRRASLALTLPYPGDLAVFPKQEEIPWLARVSPLDKSQAKAAFGLPNSVPTVLLSFGGLGLERLPWQKLQQMREYFFVTTTGAEGMRRDGNLLILPVTQHRYQDLVRAADVIVTKPGYGIVADALAHRTPVLYTDRGEFPEYPCLVRALKELGHAQFIEQDDLLSGCLAPTLSRLLNQDRAWPAVQLNGAKVAAKKILALIDQSSR